jgi:3-hydroxyisobutyrate dehydrogenase
VAMDLLSDLPVVAPAAKGLGALMVAGDYAPRFPVDLVIKDLGYAEAAAASAGTSAPMATAARTLYAAAARAGFGGENLHAVRKVLGATA